MCALKGITTMGEDIMDLNRGGGNAKGNAKGGKVHCCTAASTGEFSCGKLAKARGCGQAQNRAAKVETPADPARRPKEVGFCIN